MRPLHDDPHPAYTARMMADLTAGSRGSPADGVSDASATSTGVGALDRPQRPLDAILADAVSAVAAIWDGAVALAASNGPVPLVTAEPWAEDDGAYRERLGRPWSRATDRPHPNMLDRWGTTHGLPRARLATVEG